jgi:hypothetical protein
VTDARAITLLLRLERRGDRRVRRDVFGWQLFSPAPLQATDCAAVGVLKSSPAVDTEPSGQARRRTDCLAGIAAVCGGAKSYKELFSDRVTAGN